MTNLVAILLAALLGLAGACFAWVPPGGGKATPSRTRASTPAAAAAAARDNRRDFLARGVAIVVGVASPLSSLVVIPPPAFAAAAPQEQKDRENIVKGYNRLQYLLENWEAETTVCKTGQETTFGDRCERTPVKVMEYLGFKSTNDPLFKADATMMRLKNAVPSDREGDFYDAIDAFGLNAEEANSMAFVSSWGEANPGGGKDRVKMFIERSKKNVVASRDSLKTVMDILDLAP